MSGLILAVKTYEDHFYCNSLLSKIGGVDLKDLNNLEVSMLKLLDFSTFINEEDYEIFSSVLIKVYDDRNVSISS